MREVSQRILHFTLDLARTAGLDERRLGEGLPSLASGDGGEPGWVDWDDFIELIERLEAQLGGPTALEEAFRAALPTAFPELRAFAAIFVLPIPAFRFVMTRFMRTMYRHLSIDDMETLDGNRVRWSLTIPEPYRASLVFFRGMKAMTEVFPRHLDLPEATIEECTVTPRTGQFVAAFPPPDPIPVRSARALSYMTSTLAAQLDDAFLKISEALRGDGAGSMPPMSVNLPPASGAGDNGRAWMDRLALSPRQRDVFALLVEGRANKDIAASLRCSERNVEFHVGRILRAARVTSRSELLVKVLGAR